MDNHEPSGTASSPGRSKVCAPLAAPALWGTGRGIGPGRRASHGGC